MNMPSSNESTHAVCSNTKIETNTNEVYKFILKQKKETN